MSNRRNVLVTGASKGIGAATAVEFARSGCNVGINFHRDEEGAARTLACCRECGVEAELFKADVSDYGECERLFREFLDRFGGRIHVLVNNVGGAQVIPPGGFEDMPMEYWDAQIRFNLGAAACCARLAAKNMIDNRIPGKIINISSIHSRVTWVRRKMIPYGPAKAGLNMLTEALGVELIEHGINVNGIAPGFIASPLTEFRYTPEERQAFLRKIPAGVFGRPEDIAHLAVFLADDEKAKFIVGQTIGVDGGQSVSGMIESFN